MNATNVTNLLVAQAESEFETCQTEQQLQNVYKKWSSRFQQERGDQKALREAAAKFYDQFRVTIETIVADGALPTPPEGCTVQWFENNRNDKPRAAIVIHRIEPGRVRLKVWLPDGTELYKDGVWHRSHPLHQNPANRQTGDNGAWDYLPNRNQPKGDKVYAKHQDELRKSLREDQQRQLERKQQLAEARKAALQADAADPSNARAGEIETRTPQNL